MTEPSGFHEVGNLGNEILRKSLAYSDPASQRETVAFEKLLHPPSTSNKPFSTTGLSELNGRPWTLLRVTLRLVATLTTPVPHQEGLPSSIHSPLQTLQLWLLFPPFSHSLPIHSKFTSFFSANSTTLSLKAESKLI